MIAAQTLSQLPDYVAAKVAAGIQEFAKRDRVFRASFLLAVFVCFSPVKLLAYVIPSICLVYTLYHAPGSLNLTRLMMLISVFTVVVVGYLMIYPFFSVQNAIIWFVTFNAYTYLYVHRNIYISNSSVIKIIDWIQKLLYVQGGVAVAQYIYGMRKFGLIGSGRVADNVEGTIGLFSSAGQGDTKMFAANMSLIFLFMVPFATARSRKYLFIALGALVIHLMSSTLHQTFAIVASIALAFILVRPNLFSNKRIAILTAWLLFFAAFSFMILATVHSQAFSTLGRKVERVEEGGNPKFMFVSRMLNQIPEDFPAFRYIGFGPGQLASRANLIGSGMYFGSPVNPRGLPVLDEVVTLPLDRYLLDLWIYYIYAGNIAGSSHVPFSSWIALYGEFGAAGYVLVFLGMGFIIFRVIGLAKTDTAKMFAFSFIASVIFIFLIGFQLMYWEIPQAIFVGLLLMRVSYNRILYHQKKQ